MDGRIFDLRNNLFEHLDSGWSVKEMAERVELSESHFKKLFKTHIGTSPGVWLKELRLERARQLLETTDNRTKEIARKVGLQNESHLIRDFKKKYGRTPTEYRKQYLEKIQTQQLDGQK